MKYCGVRSRIRGDQLPGVTLGVSTLGFLMKLSGACGTAVSSIACIVPVKGPDVVEHWLGVLFDYRL
jgi:hypothetical protein